MSLDDALRWWSKARLYDLSQPTSPECPVWPGHPPFQISLSRRHGDALRADGGSSAAEIMVSGGHVGTHVDALGHISHDGLLHGGRPATDVQGSAGLSELAADELPLLVRRAVVLDVAALHDVDRLPPAYCITSEDLAECQRRSGVSLRPGDVALVRTGVGALWDTPQAFVDLDRGIPGVGEPAARMLADAGVVATGADSIAYEAIAPGFSTLPVHRLMLVERGIPLLEAMMLEELAREGIVEAVFLMLPLRLRGATGSPVRPVAAVPARSSS